MNLLLIGTLWGQIFLVKGGQHLRARRAGVCSVVTISLWAPKTLGNPPPRSPIAVYKTTFSFEISQIWHPWSRPKNNCLKTIAISSWMHISHVQPMCITLLPNMLDLIHELKPSYHQTIWTLLQTSPLASMKTDEHKCKLKRKNLFTILYSCPSSIMGQTHPCLFSLFFLTRPIYYQTCINCVKQFIISSKKRNSSLLNTNR